MDDIPTKPKILVKIWGAFKRFFKEVYNFQKNKMFALEKIKN